MFNSKTFVGVDHLVVTPHCIDGARNHQNTKVACVEITSLHATLQAELWGPPTPTHSKCDGLDQSLAVVDDTLIDHGNQCAMCERTDFSATPLLGGTCYLRCEDVDTATDSLREQLTAVLRQAREHRAWIPRNQVFMDIGPKDDAQLRSGFMSLVSLISDPDTSASVIYVADSSRLNPDHGNDDLFCLAAQLCGKNGVQRG